MEILEPIENLTKTYNVSKIKKKPKTPQKIHFRQRIQLDGIRYGKHSDRENMVCA